MQENTCDGKVDWSVIKAIVVSDIVLPGIVFLLLQVVGVLVALVLRSRGLVRRWFAALCRRL